MDVTPAGSEPAPRERPDAMRKPAFLKPWLVLSYFAVLVATLRFFTFFRAAFQWDESLYLLVADQWVQGHPPYTTVWDTKPPGIYALFALGLQVFGHSILGMRLLACLFVTGTCVFLCRIGERFERYGWLIGLMAGTLFALLTVNGGGRGANTEVFFTTLSTLAFAIVVGREDAADTSRLRDWQAWGLAGLALGFGFVIKQNALFDMVALAAIRILHFGLRPASERHPLPLVRDLISLGVGFSLPFLAVSLLFLLTHRFEDYWYATVTANRVRTIAHPFRPGVLFRGIADQDWRILLFWAVLPVAPVYLCVAKSQETRERWILTAMLVWVVTVVVAFAFTFRLVVYDYYFLQLAPALCLLCGALLVRLIFGGEARSPASRPRRRWIALAALMAVVTTAEASRPLLLGAKNLYFRGVKGHKHWADWDAQTADYIEARITPEDYIFVADNQPILYFLTRARIPTRHPYPPMLILHKDLPNLTGIDPLEELERIMAKRPVYVVKNIDEASPRYAPEARAFFEALQRHLARDYMLAATMPKTNLYRLKTRP